MCRIKCLEVRLRGSVANGWIKADESTRLWWPWSDLATFEHRCIGSVHQLSICPLYAAARASVALIQVVTGNPFDPRSMLESISSASLRVP